MGGASHDWGHGIAVDGDGSAYVTGRFQGTAVYGSYRLASAGSTDIFVAKLDSGGTVQWAKSMGGASDDLGVGIAVDGDGNAYVTGVFYGTADFGSYSLTSAGGSDIFVAKFDSGGTVQWAKSMGGASSQDYGRGIAVDGDGNAYVSGSFGYTADFGSYSLTSAGGSDIFVTKLDSGGTVQWAKSMGGAYSDGGYGIAVDGDGNTYVTGSFGYTADFGSYNLTSADGYDIFVAKLDSGGTVQWAKSMGGASYDYGYDIAVDGDGNAYVSGSFNDTADFGSYNLTSAGDSDIFVTKLDSGGTVQWAKRMGGASTDSGFFGIAVDGDGNAYVTGSFNDTADFGSYNLTTAGYGDIFVTKLDSGGTVQWAKSMGGPQTDKGAGIAVDGDGNVYVSGWFHSTADFGSYSLTSAGRDDIFVAKLAQYPVLFFTDKDTLSWSPVSGEVEWNIYRSDLLLPETFFCLEDQQAVPEMTDFEEPASGAILAYLVTTIDAAGQEGSLGYQSMNGSPPQIERLNTNPCP